MGDTDEQVAEQLLVKVRQFVRDRLTAEERLMFAALVGPGVRSVWERREVEAFALAGWEPHALPRSLAAAIRTHRIEIVGLDEAD
jgi:hypothetical protein